ncbi:band 7 [Micractinium conductrix]|uniref:Band 7 n=1 Tax=Micractinium conductrix TaxID=554055 RepID=A0A2P6V4M5_9CHLO|nr:band 7 [Micractinium conductrix]|eukprot:PSC69036.1 band 7 [Micractinium conductrix]
MALRVLALALSLAATLTGAEAQPTAGAGAATGPLPTAARSNLPRGRGMDWSLSGYREGREPIPNPPATLNVRSFGARGDGTTDDTAALQAAVKAANAGPTGGVILLPAGTYVLNRPLTVLRGGVVLRGEGQGRTVIHIPRSLSDVFSGTWSAGADGTVESSWSFGGAFISFRGVPQRSGNPATLLATVSSPVAAGDVRVPVSSTARFRVGQRVRIYVNDASTAGGRRRLLQSAAASAASAVNLTSTLLGQPAPAWLLNDPVFQSALEGRRARGGSGGGGLTVQEALVAEAVAAAEVGAEDASSAEDASVLAPAPAEDGSVAAASLDPTPRMATDGTLVAWVYGDNMADSGSEGAVDQDEVWVPGKVAAVGQGWIQLERGMPFPVRAGWRGEVHLDAPSLQEGGIEGLTIRFKWTPAARHFADRGYNALQFGHGSNSWAANVTILNADNALFFTHMQRSTLRGITVGVTAPRTNPRWPDAYNGHHAISVTEAHSNLVAEFRVATRWIHDVTVASGASLNVFTQGGGADLNIDHHRAGPFGNLFTDIGVGLGLRPFHSGGRDDRGAHAGRTSTFWNLRSASGRPLRLPACDWGALLNFVGSWTGDGCPSEQWLVKALPPGGPQNLAARRRRWPTAATAAAAAAAPASAAPELRPIQPAPAPLTADGFVPRTASPAAAPAVLQPLLQGAVAACQQCFGSTRLVGVYLRGSLAQAGCFVPGLSDADFVALHLPAGSAEEAAAEAAALAAAAARLQASFPQCAKVDIQAVALPPGSPLHTWAQRWQRRHAAAAGEDSSSSGSSCSSGGSCSSLPPSALAGQEALAFQLKTQAVCLAGWDLPAALPDVAALPPLDLLPRLVSDVQVALQAAVRRAPQLQTGQQQQQQQQQHAAPADGEGLDAAARAVRWALKRSIRAALELALCCAGGAADAAAAPAFSRDLWWCVQGAATCYPQLQPLLTEALGLYVSLAAAGSSAEQQRAAVAEGGKAAAQLAARIDSLLLGAMLAEEPGWLTYHTAGDGGSSSDSSGTGGGGGGWWQRLRVRAWAATAGDDLERGLLGAAPPPVAAPVSSPVLTLDWRQPEARQQAARIIEAAMAEDRQDGSSSSDAAAAAAAAAGPEHLSQPVLLKGAAAHWPAVRRWSLARLAWAGLQGRARLAPSLQFPFTEPRLAALLAQQRGVAALPSCVARMDAAEFAARMQRSNPCGLRSLVYGPQGGASAATAAPAAAAAAEAAGDCHEYAYFQAELPVELLAECDLSSPPFALPAARGEQPRALRQAHTARVWAGVQGSVSPTHYDLSHSFLTQIRGRKCMQFWSPDQQPYLYFYPDSHLLRRRSRVDMHAPQPGRFPLFGRATAREALLEPGDVVFFPSRWAHYTESLDASLSVTSRYAGQAGEGGE